MFGLIVKMKLVSGQRDAICKLLLEDVHSLIGCLSYVIAKDSKNADVLWVTEVWDSKESQIASVSSPQIQQAIARAKPMIMNFEVYLETEPVGGHGLVISEV
jgi:quinol monooxygenase YgiN